MHGTGGDPYRGPDALRAAQPWSTQQHPPAWASGPPAAGSTGNAKGRTGMTLGIIACCTWWIPFLSLVTAVPLGILAMVFGAQGRRLCQQALASNRGQCDAATWTGAAALVLSALDLVAVVLLLTD